MTRPSGDHQQAGSDQEGAGNRTVRLRLEGRHTRILQRSFPSGPRVRGNSSVGSETNACAFQVILPCAPAATFPTALAPEELARIFMTAYRKGMVDGLFVTSGIPKTPRGQDR